MTSGIACLFSFNLLLNTKKLERENYPAGTKCLELVSAIREKLET